MLRLKIDLEGDEGAYKCCLLYNHWSKCIYFLLQKIIVLESKALIKMKNNTWLRMKNIQTILGLKEN